MNSTPLTYQGGEGRPLVLVHGLMGRGSTWSRQVPWLSRFGAVHTYDAPWHRGREVDDDAPISTERFVDDLGNAVGALGEPAILIGHSMGGLHSWCLAAQRPDLVRPGPAGDLRRVAMRGGGGTAKRDARRQRCRFLAAQQVPRDQDALARCGQPMGQRRAPHARSDDDDVCLHKTLLFQLWPPGPGENSEGNPAAGAKKLPCGYSCARAGRRSQLIGSW